MGRATQQLNRSADEAWASIRDSPLARVYLVEAYRLATDLAIGIDAALALLPAPVPGSGFITVNHEVHRNLLQALGAASRLRGLCLDRGKSAKQSPLEHKVHLRRAGWLREILSGIDLEPLRDTQVRHTLEHFDEYVDRAALQASSGTISMPALLPIDMALSTRDLLKQLAVGGEAPTMYFVRVYISDEFRFINCGHEVDVRALRRSAAQISDRLGPLLGQEVEEEGSSIVVLTPDSFSGAQRRENKEIP